LQFLKARLSMPAPRAARQWPEHRLRRWLTDRLSRPLRVCGVVRNTGEPGGGPFWIQNSAHGLSPQLVESAQVASSSEQAAIFASSTHFNPVNMVCGLRDRHGRSFDLKKYADASAVMVTERFHQGRRLKTLEWPG